MSKISKKRRSFEIKRKRRLKNKLKGLKNKYLHAKSEEEKNEIIKKMTRLAPYLYIDKYLKT